MSGKLGEKLEEEIYSGFKETVKKKKNKEEKKVSLGTPLDVQQENIVKNKEAIFESMPTKEKMQYMYGSDEEKKAVRKKYGID